MPAADIYDTLPGMSSHSSELLAQLTTAQEKKSQHYEIRTTHKQENGSPRYINRLILEDSPYLLQHAHNPVNWYGWGAEAFAQAKNQHKPVFLSIGYSTCHWCHVMEIESFDNAVIAAILNQHFISIKLDREQRPDLDEIYMMGVQVMRGSGGWPMSNFLTDEGKPFFAATYFPPHQFHDILLQIAQLWQQDKPGLFAQADEITEAIQENLAVTAGGKKIDDSLIELAIEQTLARMDKQAGGFQGAPKFPHETMLLMLEENILYDSDPEVLTDLITTLDNMARGGIYDQIGGGFHRYSTDETWLVPHFEKMLYNQALLARVYTRAASITGDPFYQLVVTETLDYVLRDLQDAGGAFYSASDADSEDEEGLFFLWQKQEITTVLDPNDAQLAMEIFGISEQGNFEGKNILTLPNALHTVAQQRSISFSELVSALQKIKYQLYNAREKRIHPLRDEKILTDWNGLMITALVEASELLPGSASPLSEFKERYLNAALKAAEFIWHNNRDRDGNLLRMHLHGKSSTDAVLSDYAYLAESFIALYDCTLDQLWLIRAEEFIQSMIRKFWDEKAGGFFYAASTNNTPPRNEQGFSTPLIANAKAINDSALPSANSVAFNCLQKLALRSYSHSGNHHTGNDPQYQIKANALLATFGDSVSQQPIMSPYLIVGLIKKYWHMDINKSFFAQGAGFIHATSQIHPDAASDTITKDSNKKEGRRTEREFSLAIKLQPGWHINANQLKQQELSKELVATQVVLSQFSNHWQLDEVNYPQAVEFKIAALNQSLAVFDSDLVITGKVSSNSANPLHFIPLQITLQACNQDTCFAPEQIELRVTL